MKILLGSLIFSSLCFGSFDAQKECLFLLKPSLIEGIGLFAARDLPKGTEIPSYQAFCTRILNIEEVPKEFLKYCVFLNETQCACPENFSQMPLGCYVNHSDTPNLTQYTATTRITLRDITSGEELLVDYNELEEPESLKEDYLFSS